MTENPNTWIGTTRWTDYPFLSLGDAPGMHGPMRAVEVLYVDIEGYITFCEVRLPCGHEVWIKAEYLHETEDAAGKAGVE